MVTQEFLDKHIDGYLLHDLERMCEVRVFDNGFGACGYPMLMSILSGIELIGALNWEKAITPEMVQRGHSKKFFDNGWKMTFSNTKYLEKDNLQIFRKLIRNGLAHQFLSKPYISIDKGQPSLHLQTKNGFFHVDSIEFFRDFSDGYKKIKNQMVNSVDCQNRLSDILTALTAESTKILSDVNSAKNETIFITSATPQSGTSIMDAESAILFKNNI